MAWQELIQDLLYVEPAYDFSHESSSFSRSKRGSSGSVTTAERADVRGGGKRRERERTGVLRGVGIIKTGPCSLGV
jgi:hypothetical protein